MSSFNDNQLKTQPHLEWPKHIITPGELIRAISRKTRLRIMRSPIYSKLTLQFIGSWAYLLAHKLNTTRVKNIETFKQELESIEENHSDRNFDRCETENRGAPLITLSNHISCIDDPILWACLLPLTYYSTNTDSVRWTAAAVEICFSRPWHSTFFSLGKTFPIVRGAGIGQPAMQFASALLEHHEWLHLFPEGKVMRDSNQGVISNKDRGYIFKWGTSKLILDYFSKSGTVQHFSEKYIKILPFYHLGMDEVLPVGRPYIPRFGKKISIFIRPSVISMNQTLLQGILSRTLDNKSLKSRSDDEIKRIKLTRFLEEEVEKLSEPAVELHRDKE